MKNYIKKKKKKKWKCFFPPIIEVKAAGLQKAPWHASIFWSNAIISSPLPRIWLAWRETKICSYVYIKHLNIPVFLISLATDNTKNSTNFTAFWESFILPGQFCTCTHSPVLQELSHSSEQVQLLVLYTLFFKNSELSLMASSFTIPFKKLSGGECSSVWSTWAYQHACKYFWNENGIFSHWDTPVYYTFMMCFKHCGKN